MGKIKHCLDDACTRYYMTDDNKVIVTPKNVCDLEAVKGRGKNPKSMTEFKQQFNQMVSTARHTYYLSDDPGWNPGDAAEL